jgi:hypothetical protein
VAFVKHGVDPDRFARMSLRHRATIIAFISKELEDDKKNRARKGRNF